MTEWLGPARRGAGAVVVLGLALIGLAGGLGPGPAQAEGLADWQGKWAGDCRIRPPHRGVSRVDATLEVRKRAEDGSRYSWTVVFGANQPGMTSRRAYEIIARDAAKGHWVIDEKNGLKLDAWLVGNQLYAVFQVGDSLIPARYTRLEQGIVMDLPSFGVSKGRRTCVDGNSGTCALAFPLRGVQLCFLRRAP